MSRTKWPESGKDMFNVTLMTDQENKKAFGKKSDTFHPYPLEYNHSSYWRPGQVPPMDIKELFKHENKLKADFIDYTEENNHLTELKKVGFHAGYSIFFGFESVLVKRFDLPMLKWGAYLPEPVLTATTLQPYDTS